VLVPVVEFEAETLIVVAAAATVVQPVAGAAFVSAADFVVVTGPVLWVTSRLVYAVYLQ
jgi:hypothetical protein